jgi:CheY-like chemotaxis protein
MPPRSYREIILLVESDPTLAQVLSRALVSEGVTIVRAADAAEALRLADLFRPRLALLDCNRREEEGAQLAAQLQKHQAGVGVIAISDDPLLHAADATSQSRFTRVLKKSVGLQDLRQAVAAALSDKKDNANEKQSYGFPLRIKELFMSAFRTNAFKIAALIVLILGVLAGFAMATGTVKVPWQKAAEDKPDSLSVKVVLPGIELVKGREHTLVVPEEVREALGILRGKRAKVELIGVARKPTRTRPLVMPGSTLLDPTHLHRIRARFAPSPSSAEVVEIAKVAEDPAHTGKLETVMREIRSGDHIKKGDVLAVFHSVDVGNMKTNLIDAIYQLQLDEKILKKAEDHRDAVPEATFLTFQRAVAGDINKVNQSVNTLKAWGISEEDIQAVRDEAEKVKKRAGKHDKAKDALWARVEMRAPDDGIIIERNVTQGEIVADNTTILFQIARLDRLSVSANCPEDELPALEALPTSKREWTVHMVGAPPARGFIDDISFIIDPNDHTAKVKGHIANPR